MIPQDVAARVSDAVEQFYHLSSLSPEQATVHGTLAMELREYLNPIPEPLAALEQEIDMDVQGWLVDLPFALARHGFIEEAVSMGARYAELIEAENFLGDRAIILAEAGRREEALAQLTENLLRFPDDPWVVIKGGDVHDVLEQPEQAERLFRKGLELAGDDVYTRAGAVERLIPLLDNAGRTEESEALIDAEEQRERNRQRGKGSVFGNMPGGEPRYPPPQGDTPIDLFAEEGELDDFPEPYIRPLPKIGRNDPCPCGSGKKYKKCCAETEPK